MMDTVNRKKCSKTLLEQSLTSGITQTVRKSRGQNPKEKHIIGETNEDPRTNCIRGNGKREWKRKEIGQIDRQIDTYIDRQIDRQIDREIKKNTRKKWM